MDYTKKIIRQSNAWYNDGLSKARIRDLSGAVQSLRRSLQYNRDNITARNLLGLVYYGRGEVVEALIEWIISKNLRPRDNIANGYIRSIQNSARELEVINQAVRRYNQCLASCRQNEDMAIIQLKKVTASHPTFLKAHQLLALLYLHTKQNAKARQTLAAARKLDTTNETTLRYMHELSQVRGKKAKKQENKGTKKKKKKKEAIEYSLGNETIIQPAHRMVKEIAGRFTLMNIVLGAAIGAAIVWYLIVPAVDESKTDKRNKETIEYSQRINAMEAQISALTRTLDGYRADSADSEEAVQTAAVTADSYENLMLALEQYNSGNYSEDMVADTLLKINRASLGEGGQTEFDSLTEGVYPAACSTKYDSGVASLNVANYETAIESLMQVVRMNESYDDGGALLALGNAYLENGDSEAATTYFKRVNELFPDGDNGAEAREKLEAIAVASTENTDE